MKRRWLSAALGLGLALALFPATAFAYTPSDVMGEWHGSYKGRNGGYYKTEFSIDTCDADGNFTGWWRAVRLDSKLWSEWEISGKFDFSGNTYTMDSDVLLDAVGSWSFSREAGVLRRDAGGQLTMRREDTSNGTYYHDTDAGASSVQKQDSDAGVSSVQKQDSDAEASSVWKHSGKISAFTWKQDAKGWWVERRDGTYLVDTWYQSPSGLWYYLGADGYMLQDTVTPDGYRVNADGVWVE